MPIPPIKTHSHKHQSELIDEFDHLLGNCIRRFQQLEKMVEYRMLQLAAATSKPSSEIAHFLELAVAEVSFSAKLRLIATLLSDYICHRAEYIECQENPDTKATLGREVERAIASIKRFSLLEQERNRYVHSHWIAIGLPTEDTDLIPVIRHKIRAAQKGAVRNFENFSSESFREFLTEASDAENEFSQSTGILLGLLNYDEYKKERPVAR
jgi:hypothetical protein